MSPKRVRLLVDLGCIVTRLYFDSYAAPDIHHLTSGGRRIGDEHTIPLSPWYHRGVPIDGMSQAETERIYGPSLAKNRKAFEARFGTQEWLLEQTERAICDRDSNRSTSGRSGS